MKKHNFLELLQNFTPTPQMSAPRRKGVKSDSSSSTTVIRDQAAYQRAVARNAAIKANRGMVNVPMPVMGGNYLSNRPADFRSASAEVKSIDLPATTYNVVAPADIVCVNLIAPGSSFFNRIGRKIEMKNFRCVASISFIPPQTPNTAFQSNYVRMLLVYDRQTNGSFPVISDILQTTDFAGTNTTTTYSGVNLNNRDRFSILRDTRIMLPTVVSSSSGNQLLGIDFADPTKPINNFDYFVKLKGLTTMYKADSAVPGIGDIATGGLYWILYSDATSSPWICDVQMRLRYHDRS